MVPRRRRPSPWQPRCLQAFPSGGGLTDADDYDVSNVVRRDGLFDIADDEVYTIPFFEKDLERLRGPAKPNRGRTVIVASSESFADALAAGPVSARYGIPVLLTPSDRLHPAAARYISDEAVEHAIVLGGPAALSSAVTDDATFAGIEVSRLAGRDRFATAVKLADYGRCAEPRRLFRADDGQGRAVDCLQAVRRVQRCTLPR